MNPVLKAILQGVEAVGVQAAGPGGVIVDKAVHNIVDHHGSVDDNVLDAVDGAIAAIEQIQGVDIANEAMFRTAVAGLEYNTKLLRAALKDHTDGTPSV